MAIIVLSPTLFSGKACEVCGEWFSLALRSYHVSDRRCPACRDARTKVSADPARIALVEVYEAATRLARTEQKARNASYRKPVPENSRGFFTAQEWKDLCVKYDNKCLCCGRKKPLTADHVIPISRGGANTIDNIQPLCMRCNCKKWTRIIDYRIQH